MNKNIAKIIGNIYKTVFGRKTMKIKGLRTGNLSKNVDAKILVFKTIMPEIVVKANMIEEWYKNAILDISDELVVKTKAFKFRSYKVTPKDNDYLITVTFYAIPDKQ